MKKPKNPDSLLRKEVEAIGNAKGWSLGGVAAALNMSLSTLSNELAKDKPSADLLAKIRELQKTCPNCGEQQEQVKSVLRVASLTWCIPSVARAWPVGSVVLARNPHEGHQPYRYEVISFFRPDYLRFEKKRPVFESGTEFALIALPETV